MKYLEKNKINDLCTLTYYTEKGYKLVYDYVDNPLIKKLLNTKYGNVIILDNCHKKIYTELG